MRDLFWLSDEQMARLAEATVDLFTVMIDATYLKVHRTASSPQVKKGSAVD